MKSNLMQLSNLTILVLGLILTLPVCAEPGFYVGGALGKARVDENLDGADLRADSSAFRIFGGYSFTDHVGVEVSYLDLGTFSDTVVAGGQQVDVSADADGFSLAAVGRIPVSESLSLQGRAGLFFWDGQSTVAGITENEPSDQNPFVGLGLGYGLTEHAELGINLEYFDMDDAQPVVASVLLSFRF